MFLAALFTIAKTWTQPKCPHVGKEVVYNGIDSAIRKNGIWLSATTWMELDGIVLSEREQILYV